MRVCTFLTDGFETVEALAVVDILRRADIDVDLVSISGKKEILTAQNIVIQAETTLSEYDFGGTDVLFLPGGAGHKAYKTCKPLIDIVKKFNDEGKRIAAICAAPSFLGELGILEGKKATCFPGFENALKGAEVLTAPVKVVTDGNITTARGMGASIELGLELVKLLTDEEKAEQTGLAIQYLEQ
jgi:4-methyl-5(b-hydroxyethyl)-thiazole monophosphate biosynthesis